METIVKQPNGKYCLIRYGDILEINLDKKTIIKRAKEIAIEEAKKSIENAKHYGEMIAAVVRWKNTIDDETLREMGFKNTLKELTKYVPMKPLNKRYASCDFATYGNCPDCGCLVRDGMGGKDEKCDCGQRLDWESGY